MQSKDASIRKRSQIAKANRMMFLWVVVTSVVVGFALVGSLFLVQKLLFNEKVLSEKNKTIATLNNNNQNIEELKSQIRVLDSNSALSSVKSDPSDQPVQVILDALPSEANALALGASLQTKLLNDVSGLTLDALQVDPVDSETQVNSSITSPLVDQPSISFRFTVSGSEEALKQALSKLERSIRSIDIVSLRIESKGPDASAMTVQAKAYYEPARLVELRDKVVKP